MLLKQKVHFFFEDTKVDLRNRVGLKKSIEEIFRKEAKRIKFINYIFCTDKKMLEINRQFLKHNFYTDIITFDLSEGKDIQAEIYISIDRIRENAKAFKCPFKKELFRVLIHGALHLCGYDDKHKKETMIMRQKEDYYLGQIF